MAARLGSAAELEQRALEALAWEEFRAGRLTRPELGRTLGLLTSDELDGFLKQRGVKEGTTFEEGQEPVQEVGRLERNTGDERKTADELVERFRAFRIGKTLGGLSIKALIAEGRR